MVLVKFMREIGFETMESESALDALWLLKQRKDIDLITVDYNMPKMTGIQFARLVREKPELDTVKIMMITSETSLQDEASEAGVNEYLIKPFDKPMIEEKLVSMGINLAELKAPKKPAAPDTPEGNAAPSSDAGSAPAESTSPPGTAA